MEVRQCSKLSYTIDAVTQLPAPGAQATRVPTATKGWLGEETFARAEQVRLWHLRSMQPDPFDSRKSCGCQGHLCSLSSQPTVNTVCLYITPERSQGMDSSGLRVKDPSNFKSRVALATAVKPQAQVSHCVST